jgi:hypothetical protein
MSPLVKGVQRELVTRSNRLDECRPVLLAHQSLGLGVQHVAQCRWRLLCPFLAGIDGLAAGRDFKISTGRS